MLTTVSRDKSSHFKELDLVIQGLTATKFCDIVEEFRLAAFTGDAWNGSNVSIDYRTMCRFLQEVELFIIVRHAVKRGDIGMLRRIVDLLIVVFFGAAQHNYGREMLHYWWNLSSANTSELQQAILSSRLVNWLGR